MESKNNLSSLDPKKKLLNKYVKYSGLAIQLVLTVLAGVYGGYQLDKYFETAKPYYALGCALLAIVGSLYMLIRQVLRDN
ncbi:MAG: AtpZ/AtpI family protein [Bacteroidia bacterium]|nr:AtpZ/AtpI family protein [Bacteroidia bacterium]MBN4052129.1 AtpZ/AtpI family protein [Sphingobacteriaceae bacterium AH-315-L07]